MFKVTIQPPHATFAYETKKGVPLRSKAKTFTKSNKKLIVQCSANDRKRAKEVMNKRQIDVNIRHVQQVPQKCPQIACSKS